MVTTITCIVLFHPTEGIEVFEGMREMPGDDGWPVGAGHDGRGPVMMGILAFEVLALFYAFY